MRTDSAGHVAHWYDFHNLEKPKPAFQSNLAQGPFSNLAGTGAQLFAGTGNCVQFPIQSCPIASLAWLGNDRHAPCMVYFTLLRKLIGTSYNSLVQRITHTHTHPFLRERGRDEDSLFFDLL